MMQPGLKNLITDVQGLVVGNAEDEKIKTGVTVLSADKPLVTSYCVMGGAPGTRETDLPVSYTHLTLPTTPYV